MCGLDRRKGDASQMASVTPLGPEALAPELQDLYARFTQPGRDFTNQANVLAHSPAAFAHLYGLIESLGEQSTLSGRLVEIAVVTASRVNACQYCVNHHGKMLESHGLAAETVESILDEEPEGLDDIELLVRDYARLVAEHAWRIPERIFADLRKHYSDREIVELTLRIGICILFNKFNQALQIDIE
jgi:AhpD family alkylhydroperoxidase